jgi:MFS family permease
MNTIHGEEGSAGTGPRSVWNRSFFLLWQGQLVSSAGDMAYRIALGFWLLAETGSTAVMGTVMGAALLPRVVLAPLAGVVVDRFDRKLVLVLSDAISGALVLAVGLLAVTDQLEVWMVLVAGMLVGACGAFFGPASQSVLPDIVPGAGIVRANAALSTVYSGSSAVGNLVGGVVFQIIGAPLLFLLNGVSFLLSALSELFMSVPAVRRPDAARPTILGEVWEGLRFAWRSPGTRYLYLLTCLINFFGTMALFLLLPLFQRTDGLGAGWYGALMGCFAGGALAGSLLLSVLEPRPGARFALFVVVGLVDAACVAALPWMPWVGAMLALVGISGLATAMENTFVMSALQIEVPRELRGKLFALRATLVTALVPLAMACGGLLAELVPIDVLITAASAVVFAGFAACPLLPGMRGVIGFSQR